MRIIVLGAGLVGGPMAIDLASDPRYTVTAADRDAGALGRLEKIHKLDTVLRDLSSSAAVKALVADYDVVLSAVPGFMGYRTLQAVIEARRNVVDISFFPEDPFALNALAVKNDVTAIVDCGVAPGMSNVLAGHVASRLDEVKKVRIYVGGLPQVREWPYEYKAGFSPADVIEEFVRPARFVENGVVVVRPALSEVERVNFDGVGTLEAFNTDGLRTLMRTIGAPDMKEKTLRYPGHAEKMAMLRDTGYFNQDEIEVGGTRIRPRDVTAKLLFPKWKLGEKDRDLTAMKVIVEGTMRGDALRYTYDLLDRYDPETGTHSMARTTGYTATVVLRMLAQGLFAGKGIIPPEAIGQRPECVRYLLNGLAERKVVYHESMEKIEA